MTPSRSVESQFESQKMEQRQKAPVSKNPKGEIWWSNGILFIAMHLFAVYGMFVLSPWSQLSWKTTVLCFISWQLASFGITLGYHRLWSHRAYTATTPARVVLAWMGCMGFQGSIKWWVLRHRLHHRFTDSPEHDPYSATRGLWYSHCGWIFRKPVYARMKLIEKADLEADPVVRFQHRHYIPLALGSGLVLPALIGHYGWHDGLGGLVWGGAVARLLIWHTTFCINSLAHWTGLQPYTHEVTAKGNYLLALLTSGEGNHNFHHAFPNDFRNGPHPADWDPSKWIIWMFHKYTPFVPTVTTTPDAAILKARAHVHHHEAERLSGMVPAGSHAIPEDELPVWSKADVLKTHGAWIDDDGLSRRRVLLLVQGFVLDVGEYIEEHPGGGQLLLAHAVTPLSRSSTSSPASTTSALDSGYSSATQLEGVGEKEEQAEAKALKDATRAFFGGMNNHSQAAKEQMRCLRIAKLRQ